MSVTSKFSQDFRLKLCNIVESKIRFEFSIKKKQFKICFFLWKKNQISLTRVIAKKNASEAGESENIQDQV